MILAPDDFKYIDAMLAEPVNAEADNLFMCSCGVKADNFTLWSYSLIVRHYHILKAPRLVLAGSESAGLWIKIPSRVKSSRHFLTH